MTFNGATLDVNGTWNNNGATLTFSAAGAQTFNANSDTYDGLSTGSTASVTLAEAATMTGTGTVATGTTWTLSAGLTTTATTNWTVAGTLTHSAGVTLGANVAWTFDVDSSYTITGILSAPSGTGFTFAGATFDMNGTYTANGGTLTFDGGAATFAAGSGAYYAVSTTVSATTISQTETATLTSTLTVASTRTWNVAAAITLSTGGCTVTGTLTPAAATTTLSHDGILTVTGTYGAAALGYDCNITGGSVGATTVDVQAGATFQATSATMTWTTSTGDMTCSFAAGTFTHNSGTFEIVGAGSPGPTLSMNANTVNIFSVNRTATSLTISSNITVAGTLTKAGVGSVLFNNAVSWTQTGAATLSGTGAFGSDNSYTFDLNNTMSMTASTFSAPNATGTFTFSGATWTSTVGSTFTANSGTMTFDRAASQTFTNGAGGSMNNVTTSGAGTAVRFDTSVGGGWTVSGTTTIVGSTTVTGNAAADDVTFGVLTVTGTFGEAALNWIPRCNGDVTVSGIFIASSGTTRFGSTAATWDMNGTYTHSSGTLEISGSAKTFNAGSALQTYNNVLVSAIITVTLTESMTCAGTFTLNSGGERIWAINASVTFRVDGATLVDDGALTRLGTAATAYTLDLNGSFTLNVNATLQAPNATGTFTFAGATFDMNGTYTANSGTLQFDSAVAQTFLAGSGTYQSLTVAGAGGVSQSEACTINGTLAVTSGNWTSSATITFGAASAMTPSASRTFTGDTVALTLTGGMTFGANVAWTFDMNANLTIAGTLSAPNATGTFTFSGATLDNNGTYTANSGTLTFDRAAAQTFAAGSGTYVNLTLSGANTAVTESEAATINGAVRIVANTTFTLQAAWTLVATPTQTRFAGTAVAGASPGTFTYGTGASHTGFLWLINVIISITAGVVFDPAFVILENCTINDLTWSPRNVVMPGQHVFSSHLPK